MNEPSTKPQRNPSTSGEVVTTTKRTFTKAKFKPTKDMRTFADKFLELAEEGKNPTVNSAAVAAGINRQAAYHWVRRWPNDFKPWLRSQLQCLSLDATVAIAQTARNVDSPSQVSAAKLLFQYLDGWSEKQEVEHTHSGSLELIPGENELSHRIAAARQHMDERLEREAARDTIDVTPEAVIVENEEEGGGPEKS